MPNPGRDIPRTVFGGILLTYAAKALIRIPLTALPLLWFGAAARRLTSRSPNRKTTP